LDNFIEAQDIKLRGDQLEGRLRAREQELYECYRSFYGSLSRRLRGIFSSNKFKRRTYRYLASQQLLGQLRSLI